MARKKKQTEDLGDQDKIAKWLKENKVNKIAQNVGGDIVSKGFFNRRKRPATKVAVTPTTK